jgi:NitT/TauT family transport system ATP-binding protein
MNLESTNPPGHLAAVDQPYIVFEDISKTYAGGSNEAASPIFQDINLSIGRGEFVSLIGPSGCGKSTILKLVAGLTSVSRGKLSIDGMNPTNAREIVSFIFQDATLLPWRTVAENVGLRLELERTLKFRRDEKVKALLELVGLAAAAKSYPRQLSGGMKMRVSIARALSTRPRVLLMDEPFAALDEITRARLNEEMLRLQDEQGWTALFVTHSVSEAVFLSSRVLIMAARPGRSAHEIPIDLPYPRTADTRLEPAYEDLVAQVSKSLRGVSGQ